MLMKFLPTNVLGNETYKILEPRNIGQMYYYSSQLKIYNFVHSFVWPVLDVYAVIVVIVYRICTRILYWIDLY